MEFIDLAAQQKRISEKIETNFKKVLRHGKYIMGPEIKQIEEALSHYVGVKHAISCASGTDALLMALMAYDIGPGDAVFTTPFTFIATAEVISLLGATPVFADIDSGTFNIDPQKLEEAVHTLKKRSNGGTALRPKAVITVDLFGLTADYDVISSIVKKHNLLLIEDAAQSFGAEYKGKKSCCFGNVACTSFFPAKPLGCYGDGGMCFTDDDHTAEVLRSIRVHGQGGHKYDNVRIGVNGRLDTLQAAILLAKFEIFEEEIELRNQVANRYTDFLTRHSSLVTPLVPDGTKSTWAQYSLLAVNEKHREALQTGLNKAGVPTAIYYPKPLHLQDTFAFLGNKKGDFPVSEAVAGQIFSLPMHPYLTPEDQGKIAHVLNSLVKNN